MSNMAMAMWFTVPFFVMSLCSTANSQCQNNRCPSNLKYGGRFQMSNFRPFGGGAPSIVVIQLPAQSPTLLRAPSGRFHIWKNTDECSAPAESKNLVCPAESGELPCMDGQMPCDHNYHPPGFNRNDSTILKFDITSNNLLITWRAWNESFDHGYGPVAGYRLEYRQSGSHFTNINLEKNVTSYRINDIANDTQYDFRLTLAGGGLFTGYGPPTKIYNTTTPCSDPPTLSFNIRSYTKNSANFSVLNAIEWSCKRAIMYIERWEPVDGHWTSLNISRVTEVEVGNLEPCTNYTYRINMTGGTKNTTSENVTFTSLAEDPSKPSLSLISANASAFMNVTFPHLETWSCTDWSVTLHRKKKIQNNWNWTMDEIPKLISDTGLKPCTAYRYRIKISSFHIETKNVEISEGQSKPEEKRQLETSTSEDLIIPVYVTAPTTVPTVYLQNNMTRSLTFNWSLPACLCCKASFIENYSYVFKQNNRILQNNIIIGMIVTFDELIPYTHYTFEVRASTVGGDGNYSIPLNTTTTDDKPPQMDPLQKKFWNATNIVIQWEPPFPPHGIITGYRLRYGMNISNATWEYEDVEATRKVWTIRNVIADSDYLITIRAKTRLGFGNWSEEIHVRTEETVPGVPRSVAIVGRSETMIQVSWRSPEFENGDITKYEIYYKSMSNYTSEIVEGTITIKATSMSLYMVNITSLQPSTIYRIEISAYTSVGKGGVAFIKWSTNVTSDLKAIDVKEVTVTKAIDPSGDTYYVITLPPLTQIFATNYIITIRLSEKDPKFHVWKNLMKSDKEIECLLTKDDMKNIDGNYNEDWTPVIHVGVESKIGEETIIEWSNVIEFPVTTAWMSSHDLFITIIVTCVAVFGVLFVTIVSTSFIFRHLQRDWKYKKTDFEDEGSIYHALHSKKTESIDRYMPLKFKPVPSEKKLLSVNSCSKMKLENGETEIKHSCSIDNKSPAKNVTLLVLEASADSTVVKASKEKAMDPSIFNSDVGGAVIMAETYVKKGEHENTGITQSDTTYSTVMETKVVEDDLTETGDKLQHSSKVTGNPDATTEKGCLTELRTLGAENKRVSNVVIQKAADKFREGLMKIYNSEIYEQVNPARIMNSKSVKTKDQSEATIESKRLGNGGCVVRQSYDKVIMSDASPITVMHTNAEGNCQTEHSGESSDGNSPRRSKDKNERNEMASYIDVDEIDTKPAPLDSFHGRDYEGKCGSAYSEVGSSYLTLDDEAMTRDRDTAISNSGTSYIVLDEKAMADDTMAPAQHLESSYFTVDDNVMTRNRDGTIFSPRATYIELNEEAMTEDTSSASAKMVGTLFPTLDGEEVTRDRGDIISSSRATYIELNEEAMTEDTLSPAQDRGASYLKLDEEAMARDRDDTIFSSKASYIELDEQAMAEDTMLPVQNVGASYLTLDDEAMARDREATLESSKASYIELDDLPMAEDTSSPAHNGKASNFTSLNEQEVARDTDLTMINSQECYSELDKESMTYDKENSRSYTTVNEEWLINAKATTIDDLPSYNGTFKDKVNDDKATTTRPQHYGTYIKGGDIYDEPGTKEIIYDDSIVDEKNPGNSMVSNMNGMDTYDDTIVANTGKYDSSVASTSFGPNDGSIVTPSNEDNDKDIYFDADEIIGGSDNKKTKNDTLIGESYYDETSFPEDAHSNDTDESQSIYEEIPAAIRARYQKRKQATFLQNVKNKMSRSGASRGTKGTPLPALPLRNMDARLDGGNSQQYASSLGSIQEFDKIDSAYEELPGLTT